MKKHVHYIAVLLLINLMTSCVPQRKLEEEQAKRKTCDKDLAAMKITNQECETSLTEATKSLTDNQKQIAHLQKDTAELGNSYRTFASKYQKLNEVNDQLLDKYNRLLAGNVADTKKLSGELQGTQEQLLKKQDELKLLETKLNAQKEDLNLLIEELEKCDVF